MRLWPIAPLVMGLVTLAGGYAHASGTALVQQRDGSIKTYDDVIIQIRNEEMVLTTADGVGTLVITLVTARGSYAASEKQFSRWSIEKCFTRGVDTEEV